MKILIAADGRSPITRRWVRGLLAMQNEVILVSTFPCQPLEGVAEMIVLPVAFASLSGSQAGRGGKPAETDTHQPAQPPRSRRLVARFRNLFQRVRYSLGPLTLRYYGPQFRRVAQRVQPDVIHALRIPFEGMLASYAPPEMPLAVSIWGNDLTLHGKGSAAMRRFTTRTLQRADGLAADAQRDIRLARAWGFDADKPVMTVPGSGGIDLVEISTARPMPVLPDLPQFPEDTPLVINPRGFRPGSVRNDIFFQAVPMVLERVPDAHFLCAAMQGQEEAQSWLERLEIGRRVHLLPYLAQEQLWAIFQRAAVSVSISAHDGTPNSLLEAMAIGCFPIAGDIESLREWIVPGVNGLLVEADKAQALAEALVLALTIPSLRGQAAEVNRAIIQERAELNLVRSQIAVFYERLLQG
ncbi:MAG: glycosyltransferase family 4 protein [Anaerolineaceae bacterium]|jgi:glycosyltransferase involved in cell wall biosynthesis|nr:glycosyltransferase family 4 protein [Anaerolineaceae bacterium]